MFFIGDIWWYVLAHVKTHIIVISYDPICHRQTVSL